MFLLNRLVGILRPVSLFTFFSRTFIPSTYACDSQWASRLAHEAFQSISARDLGLSIMKTAESSGTVSPLDYDIFVNKINELDSASLDFIENIIDRYNRTQSALTVTDSTPHAIVRAYIDFQEPQRLITLAQRRANTGIFLDSVSAMLLLDKFLDQQDWIGAINAVWELYLQDYFSVFSSQPVSPMIVACLLHTSKMLLDTGLSDPVNEVEEPAAKEDEVEYKFVKYVRNPNYDNFFDIDRPRLKLGFLLHGLSDLMERRPQALFLTPSVQESFARFGCRLSKPLRLLGLAYSDRLEELDVLLKQLTDKNHVVDWNLSESVVAKLIRALDGTTVRPDDSAPKRGEPVLPTSDQLAQCLEELKRLGPLAQTVEDTFDTCLEDFVYTGVLNNAECLDKETSTVQELYTKFAADRSAMWQSQLAEARRRRAVDEAKQTLRDLLDEEERLKYFEDSEEVHRQAWLAPRTRQEREWSRRKEWKRDLERYHEKLTGEAGQGLT